MPSRPIEAPHKNAARPHLPHAHPRTLGQHGKTHSLSPGASMLLRFPSESLTHITSFLDPDALFALSGTNRQLHAHVKDDNTWRRAYVYQFLRISPESDLRDDEERKSLMLRREESTWRREFILRHNLRRRWERSRNQPVTHVPHHSDVVSMHLMPNTTLLTASLQYGIVARSYPLTGKILRGYLDASGTANGLGHGNPNLEFSPHVTATALASEGRTAKVLWGFRNGEVAVTTSVRAMEGNRPSAAKHTRCKVEDCHDAAVCALAWGMEAGQEGPTAFVTGDMHGQVKLWDAKRMKCIWASTKKEGLARDVCGKIAVNIAQGVVVAAMESNKISIWSGLGPLISSEQDFLDHVPNEIAVPPFPAFNASQTPVGVVHQRELTELNVSIPRDSKLRVFVAFKDDPYLYRLDVDLATSAIERSAFGDGSGAVTAVKPVFATQDGESSFVLVGDQLGGICLYDCDAPSPVGNASTAPLRKIDAHEDGAVTALAWNTVVLASGSSRGTIKVWDSLSLAHLRSFSSPGARPAVGEDWDAVGQILLERTVLLVSVGSRVMAWQAGPISRHDKAKGKQVRVARNSGLAKWQQQIEMYRDIAESRRDLDEEQTYTRRAFGREREQQSTLASLGLSEVEAVEYALMLSRDEEEDRRLQYASSAPQDDGIFMPDFDDPQTPASGPSAFIESQPTSMTMSRTSSSSSHSIPNGNVVVVGRSLPRTVPSHSNHKIQVSPRMRPEPTEAGFASSPLNGSMSSSINTQASFSVSSTTDLDHFPPVSRTPSSTGASMPSTPASPGAARRSGPGSPESLRNAWATPLSSRRSLSSTPSSVLGPASPLLVARRGSPPDRVSHGGPSLISAGFARQTSGRSGSPEIVPLAEATEREDEELRFAIELSLAEARSRGENV